MINDKELQSVSTLGAFDRYRYFIKKIADADELWTLKSKEEKFALSEVDNNFLLPFWSAKEYIQSCLNGEWKNYNPLSLSLDEFESKIVPIIKGKGYLLDIFPVNNKAGFVVTIDEFIHDLNMELSNYE